jgi:hypothetical protein
MFRISLKATQLFPVKAVVKCPLILDILFMHPTTNAFAVRLTSCTRGEAKGTGMT